MIPVELGLLDNNSNTTCLDVWGPIVEESCVVPGPIGPLDCMTRFLPVPRQDRTYLVGTTCIGVQGCASAR